MKKRKKERAKELIYGKRERIAYKYGNGKRKI